MTQTTHQSAFDDAEDRQVAEQLRDTEARLLDQYDGRAGVTADQVTQVIASVRDRFADARIRSFLPILVERATRQELDA
ncbi:MAG TPA: hypothetical protein VK735_42925 [Pseudonocardia sp.]|uniref:three-helix bundle dimerization domain-containing protein n=1 Tax=Pseudonocardia sp. TaxID=60912 RepID=UPI002C7AC052|nr:hypothetical protein [Pseudonocardia sp.]HTF54242.1 hypothetical protein [Pseudonocardia sp.]